MQTPKTESLPNVKLSREHIYDTGILTRLVLIALLGMTLMETTRWAMDITNANAKQISANMKGLGMEPRPRETVRPIPLRDTPKAGQGPILEPIERKSKPPK